MKSLPGGVVVRDTKKGPVYYARVEYDGKQHHERCESEKAARDRAGALRDAIRTARNRREVWTPKAAQKTAYRVPRTKPVTFENFCKTFLADWASSRRPRTKAWYAERVKSLNKQLGARAVETIKKADVVRMMNATVAAISPASANANLKALRIILARAVEWEVIPANPAAGVKPLGQPERPDRYLFAEEYKALQDHYPKAKPWVGAMVETAIHTGLRRGELLLLDWEKHVDLPRRVIHLAGGVRKNRKGLTVPINADLAQVLAALPRATKTTRVFHEKGQPVTLQQLRDQWEKLRVAAKLENYRWHDHRHTAASWMVMRGVPLYEVGAILGHSNPRITQKYAHLSPDYLKGATAALEGYKGPARKSEAVTESVTLS
jgi:integrase